MRRLLPVAHPMARRNETAPVVALDVVGRARSSQDSRFPRAGRGDGEMSWQRWACLIVGAILLAALDMWAEERARMRRFYDEEH